MFIRAILRNFLIGLSMFAGFSLTTLAQVNDPSDCTYGDVVDAWNIYRIPYKTTVAHDLYINKKIEISLIEEGDASNGIPDRIGVRGLEGNSNQLVFVGLCDRAENVYQVAGWTENHDCKHKVTIERADDKPQSYYPQCDSVPEHRVQECIELTRGFHPQHISFTYPKHDADRECTVADPGNHGGTAHGGND